MCGEKGLHRSLSTFVFIAVFVGAMSTIADTWSKPTKRRVTSQNGKYCFDIVPPDMVRERLTPGRCKGILYRKDSKGLYTKLWERHLINNISPVSAYVSPDGRFVVTLNEWSNWDLLPIVIYGEDGSLLRIFTDKVLDYALEHECNITLSGVEWARGGVAGSEFGFFDPKVEFFIIKSESGPYYLVDLADMELKFADTMEAIKKVVGNRSFHRLKKLIHETALKGIKSSDPAERAAAAKWCGQLKLKAAIPELRKLLKDTSSYTRTVGKETKEVQFVAEAAKYAIEQMGKGSQRKEK